jgi:hypothetical protein
MQDEPGGSGCFSHKMSLKERSGMLGIERKRANETGIESGGDPGIFRGQ